MTIGSTIKTLRRQADMTQEQLAELLYISASAVSQWETDRVLPDVTQIPLLANIFHVSADVILGIDHAKDEEKINALLASAEEARLNSALEARTDILREANRQFPRSYKIMAALADALVCAYSRKGIKEYDEVFCLCRRILDECTDSMIRYETLDTLGVAYDYAGEQEKMLELAEQMTPFRYSREAFMLWRWSMTGDEGLRQRQKYLDALIGEMTSTLDLLAGQRHDDGSFVYSIADRIALWTQTVALVELLYPDGDYHIAAQDAERACGWLTSAYLVKGDLEAAMHWLQKGSEFAIHFDTYDHEAEHSSPALRGYVAGGWIMEEGRNHCSHLLEYLLEDKEATSIRHDPRVETMIERLRQIAIQS